MRHWNKVPIDRQQLALFVSTLDAFLGADHPVRMVEEILQALDFSVWEQEYDQFTGQPPIHPRVVVGVLLYAPNYTPVLAVDAEAGILVDAVVLGGKNEDAALLPSLERVQETLGELPDPGAPGLADSAFHTGSNLESLEKKQIEGLIPERQSFAENPAKRPDPTQAVAEADREKLPVNPQAKVLDKAAFIYVSEQDASFCPMGKALEFAGTRTCQRENRQGVYRVYQGKQCAECALRSRCVPAKSTVIP